MVRGMGFKSHRSLSDMDKLNTRPSLCLSRDVWRQHNVILHWSNCRGKQTDRCRFFFLGVDQTHHSLNLLAVAMEHKLCGD